MFSLWKGRVQISGLGLYNLPYFSTISPASETLMGVGGLLYKFNTQTMHLTVHYFYSRFTGVIGRLYPQSTEPTTTTTIYKGGRE